MENKTDLNFFFNLISFICAWLKKSAMNQIKNRLNYFFFEKKLATSVWTIIDRALLNFLKDLSFNLSNYAFDESFLFLCFRNIFLVHWFYRCWQSTMEADNLRIQGKAMVDFVANYWETLREKRMPFPDVQPGYIKELVGFYRILYKCLVAKCRDREAWNLLRTNSEKPWREDRRFWLSQCSPFLFFLTSLRELNVIYKYT